MFRPQKNPKKTRIKWYNTLARPVLLYGSETWTIKARDARRITAAEMKYMRRTAGYTWTDYKTNTQITKELKITPILDKLLEYKSNWIQHVNRMPRNRLPRVMKYYSPTGRRNYGRPLKRLLDTRDRNELTRGPTAWQIYDDDYYYYCYYYLHPAKWLPNVAVHASVDLLTQVPLPQRSEVLILLVFWPPFRTDGLFYWTCPL